MKNVTGVLSIKPMLQIVQYHLYHLQQVYKQTKHCFNTDYKLIKKKKEKREQKKRLYKESSYRKGIRMKKYQRSHNDEAQSERMLKII